MCYYTIVDDQPVIILDWYKRGLKLSRGPFCIPTTVVPQYYYGVGVLLLLSYPIPHERIPHDI